MKKICVLDTETTGLQNHPIHGHPQVIQLARLYLHETSLEEIRKLYFDPMAVFSLGKNSVTLYKPSMPIAYEAFRVHGLAFKDVADAPKSETISKDLIAEQDLILGFNLQFDFRCLNFTHTHLCVMKLIPIIEKQAPLFLGKKKNLTHCIQSFYPAYPELLQKSHSALGDTQLTLLVLAKLLQHLPAIETFEQLHKYYSFILANK